MSKILLYQKDFTHSGGDKYYLYTNATLTERSPREIVEENSQLICHDYWLISPSISESTGKLPANVVDIYEFSAGIAGSNEIRKSRDQAGIHSLLTPNIAEAQTDNARQETISKYIDIFYRKSEFSSEIYCAAGEILLERWNEINSTAQKNNEARRQSEIEVPLLNILHKHLSPGIKVNTTALRKHKEDIEYEYYKALKVFSSKFNLPLETPSDQEIIDFLEPKGYSFDGISVNQILDFVPTPDGFAEAVKDLRKIAASRQILSAIPLSTTRINPIIDTFGSITSRIYFKDPVLQNIAKRHRDIIAANDGFSLSYVDYDQFEVGVMAALSGDAVLTDMYASDDLYEKLSEEIFGNRQQRKFSKRLFLSYAYGMKLNNIAAAAYERGAERSRVKSFFKKLTKFEEWKASIQAKFLAEGCISTSEGNYLRRDGTGPLTEKERRSCVSQVVQGTASLIFKKSLIALDKMGKFRILIPMHDAVLVEHRPNQDPKALINIFSNEMTNHFSGKITGKASLEKFFPSEPVVPLAS
jgi:DNA polymerase-1